jgi:heme-degrading monooxygenase HmoA
MFVVIFEVQPRAERWNDYLDTAKVLRPELERIPGFIDNFRYSSDRVDGRLLSISTWADEKAVIRWRTHGFHHKAGQARGRREIFGDYHLRVGEVVTDSRPPAGASLREQRFDETQITVATAVTITESSHACPSERPGSSADLDCQAYTSLADTSHKVLLESWPSVEQAKAAELRVSDATVRRRVVRVIRDYGMFDRREAPQWFPDESPTPR